MMVSSSKPADWFSKIKQMRPNTPLLRTNSETVEYDDLFIALHALVGWFDKQGLSKGDRVVVAMSEDKNSVLLVLAMIRYGLPITTFDPNAPLAEAGGMFDVIKPKAVFAANKTLGDWRAAQLLESTCEVVLEESELKELLSRSAPADIGSLPACVVSAEPDANDISLVVYTSGTTGRPKGVCLSYRAVFQQSLDMAKHIGITKDAIILNMFRFYQIGGIVNGVLLAFLQGATLFRPYPVFSLEKLADLFVQINRVKASHFILVPSFLSILLHHEKDFSRTFSKPSFKCFVSTADLLPEVSWRRAEELSGKIIVNTYGLTEANTVTFTDIEKHHPRHGTIGRPNDCWFKIVDENRSPVASGKRGELAIAGKTVMDGYIGDEERTSQVLRNGWFYTGDFVRQDANGNFVYLGRDSDVIVCGGQTIFPAEISTHLMNHKDVAEAYTLGVPHQNWGELVVSCIVVRRKNLESTELAAFLRQHISPYKVPRRFVFLDEIPTSDRGKVRRKELLSLVTSIHANEGKAAQ